MDAVIPATVRLAEISTTDKSIFQHEPKGQAAKAYRNLTKVDSITMKFLPNVCFEFKLVGGSYRQEFTTDINGEIDLSKLIPGAYEVRELEAPNGYLIDDAVRIVQVNPDENANIVFANTPSPPCVLSRPARTASGWAGCISASPRSRTAPIILTTLPMTTTRSTWHISEAAVLPVPLPASQRHPVSPHLF